MVLHCFPSCAPFASGPETSCGKLLKADQRLNRIRVARHEAFPAGEVREVSACGGETQTYSGGQDTKGEINPGGGEGPAEPCFHPSTHRLRGCEVGRQ